MQVSSAPTPTSNSPTCAHGILLCDATKRCDRDRRRGSVRDVADSRWAGTWGFSTTSMKIPNGVSFCCWTVCQVSCLPKRPSCGRRFCLHSCKRNSAGRHAGDHARSPHDRHRLAVRRARADRLLNAHVHRGFLLCFISPPGLPSAPGARSASFPCRSGRAPGFRLW